MKARDQKCARKNDGQGKRCEQGKRDAKKTPAGTEVRTKGDCGRGRKERRPGKEIQQEQWGGDKNAGRVTGLCERRRQKERNCSRSKVGERKQTPAGGERCARTETARNVRIREQEKRGAYRVRNSGRGKGWAKAEATKPTPKPVTNLLGGRVRAASFGAACASRDDGCKSSVVECCSNGRRGSSAAYAVAYQPKIHRRDDLNRPLKFKSCLALIQRLLRQ